MRDNGGHMVALKWTMKNIYGIEPGEVFWAASDVGWVVGHSYIVYAPLLHGCTTILYEGKPVGTPDAGAFWRVIAEHEVAALFTAPTAFRAIKKEDPDGELIAQLRSVRASARCSSPASAPTPIRSNGRKHKLNVPVIDHWWQTETGWSIAANPVGLGTLPVKYGSPTRADAGLRHSCARRRRACQSNAGEIGRHRASSCRCRPAACRRCGTTTSASARAISQHFPGYYETADAGFIDEDGYVYIMARTDDIINVAGHRLSTGGMEEVLAGHPDVAECAVIGIADEMKGQVPMRLRRAEGGRQARPKRHRDGMSSSWCAIRSAPVAAFKTAMVVQRLPKTRRARSCAAPCARSPTARPGRCRRRSTIRRSSTRSPAHWLRSHQKLDFGFRRN